VYDALIRPHEKEIIWYHPSGTLPSIKPAESHMDPRPVRAREKADQTIVAGKKDGSAKQMIYLPNAPEVELPKPVPLPNVVAATPPPPKSLRAFVTPAPKPVVRAPITLPEAPVQNAASSIAALPIETAPLRPQPKAFTAPAPKPVTRAAITLPEAPNAGTLEAKTPSVQLPDARAPLRSFTPPPQKSAAVVDDAALPAPPQASLAIVSLDPSKVAVVTPPPGSRPADFSAGPQPRAEGGVGSNHDAMLEVPDLLVHGGSQPVQPTIRAALTPTQRNLLAGVTGVPPSPATRVSNAPDPILQGRVIYTLAIEMPNVTSYSGSWMVWFAEHEALSGPPPGEMIAPLALRKTDPGYIPSAAEERVEGVVRLYGIIRKDGRVDGIQLLRHLDERLDHSAQQALSKWLFRPAMRNGAPVEVDAVFEVPFRLAPRPKR
jgi:TonB family protein